MDQDYNFMTGHQSKDKERLQEDEDANSLMGVAALYVSNE